MIISELEFEMIREIIKEIRIALQHELYITALATALTLPDICGQAEYPHDKIVTHRYTKWLQSYAENLKFSEYQNCSIDDRVANDIYKLRCAFLHQGSSDISTLEYFELVKIDPHRANQFQVFRESQLCGDDRKPGPRKISINIVMLCELLCDRAEKYYSVNKEKFGFINFNLVNIDYQTAEIFGIKNRNVYGDSEKTT